MRKELHQKVFDGELAEHFRGAFESGRAFGLTLPAVIMNCYGYDPILSNASRNIPASYFAQHMWRLSDRINVLEREMGWTHVHDAIFSKLYFDDYETRSNTEAEWIRNATMKIVGFPLFRFDDDDDGS